MTRAEVAEKIARMKAVQRGLVKAVGSDYNDQRRFQVREIEVNGKVVSRLMKIDTNLKYLPSEDLFNEIYDLHLRQWSLWSGPAEQKDQGEVCQCNH